jgi:hypothetical protein
MTRKKLLTERRRIECARFFEALGRGASSPAMRSAIPRMRAMADRCGYAARADRPGHRVCHKSQSKAMRRFKSRTAFYLAFAPADCPYDQMRAAFLARPAYDETVSTPLPYWDLFDERTGAASVGEPRFVLPAGYIEWRVRGVVWLIPVTRAQREVAVQMLRERRATRVRPFVAVAELFGAVLDADRAVVATSAPNGESPR